MPADNGRNPSIVLKSLANKCAAKFVNKSTSQPVEGGVEGRRAASLGLFHVVRCISVLRGWLVPFSRSGPFHRVKNDLSAVAGPRRAANETRFLRRDGIDTTSSRISIGEDTATAISAIAPRLQFALGHLANVRFTRSSLCYRFSPFASLQIIEDLGSSRARPRTASRTIGNYKESCNCRAICKLLLSSPFAATQPVHHQRIVASRRTIGPDVFSYTSLV